MRIARKIDFNGFDFTVTVANRTKDGTANSDATLQVCDDPKGFAWHHI